MSCKISFPDARMRSRQRCFYSLTQNGIICLSDDYGIEPKMFSSYRMSSETIKRRRVVCYRARTARVTAVDSVRSHSRHKPRQPIKYYVQLFYWDKSGGLNNEIVLDLQAVKSLKMPEGVVSYTWHMSTLCCE